MGNWNRTQIIGNITSDPEVGTTNKGTALCEFTVAVNKPYTDDREETNFIPCIAWVKVAETIGKYLKRGHQIFIEGELRVETWEDKQTGHKRSKMRVNVIEFQFLERKAK